MKRITWAVSLAIVLVALCCAPAHSVSTSQVKQGDTYTDAVTGMEFVFVTGACFQMGDVFDGGEADEKPVHEVCVDDFWIGKYEVTQGQWKALMGSNPAWFKKCGDNCPVEMVDWISVREYIAKLNSRSSGKYRLPTEAEWEYAARSGGKREKYSGGDDIDSVAWYKSNAGGATHPVGQRKPNGSGIYDMNGNVWEWVQDFYLDKYYAKTSQYNPTGPNRAFQRVIRGGGWDSLSEHQRTTRRGHLNPGPSIQNPKPDAGPDVGFRLLRIE